MRLLAERFVEIPSADGIGSRSIAECDLHHGRSRAINAINAADTITKILIRQVVGRLNKILEIPRRCRRLSEITSDPSCSTRAG